MVESPALHPKNECVNEQNRGLGSELSEDQYEQALADQKTYRKFLNEHVFSDATILILPSGIPQPRYRDQYDGFVVLLLLCVI
jgi:hypothetical protein